jgi:signal transduction histidine kinase
MSPLILLDTIHLLKLFTMPISRATHVKARAADHQQKAEIIVAEQSINADKDQKEELKSIVSVPFGTKQKRSHTIINALAHEIRNPLTNIRLSLDLIESEGIAEKQEKYFAIISRNTHRIDDLITTMLLSLNTKKERAAHYSINQLLDESLEMAKDRIILQKIKVEKIYQHDRCDAKLEKSVIKIAFLNIINNAIEAMSETKGVLKIITSVNDGKCNVTIEDNGTGISSVNLKKIFVPFFTTKPMGMGVGLPSTFRILQSQHATVKVESEEGKGTRFIISF